MILVRKIFLSTLDVSRRSCWRDEKLTTVEIMVLVDELIEAFPWTAKCVETIDVTNIGSQYDLKPFMAMTEDDFAW
jgi:hypothetical protein